MGKRENERQDVRWLLRISALAYAKEDRWYHGDSSSYFVGTEFFIVSVKYKEISMEKKIESILQDAKKKLDEVDNKIALTQVNAAYLGKNGALQDLMKELKSLPAEQKPIAGKKINELRDELTLLFNHKVKGIEKLEIEQKIANEHVDVTLPVKPLFSGTMHPIEKVKTDLIDYLVCQGFTLNTGHDIETDHYCFEALNIPKDHPARDMQDTFYINGDILLRTHTSCVQIRTMEQNTPPIKMISLGNVYRVEEIDATHSPMFSQLEILVVDKNVTMADCIGTIESILKHMLGDKTKIRVRPSFFPFTEPSIEVDATCPKCAGKCGGCSMCKDTGFVEMLGAGMVNPKVLENCGIDSSVYQGFAAGFGLERLTMMKYGISDIRDLFENDINFLKQFK